MYACKFQTAMGAPGGMMPPGLINQNMQNQGQGMPGPGAQQLQGAVSSSIQTNQTGPPPTFQSQPGQVMGPAGNQGIQTATSIGMPSTQTTVMTGPVPTSQNTTGQQTQPPTSQQQTGVSQVGPGTGVPVRERHTIWQGVLEWIEKGKNPNDNQKVTKHVPCQVSSTPKEGEPDL